MDITEVKIYLKNTKKDNGGLDASKRLMAYAAVTFDECFVVRDLKLICGNNGMFVAMPSKRVEKRGMHGDEDRQYEYRDVAHPITHEARGYIHEKVLEAYRAECESLGIPCLEAVE